MEVDSMENSNLVPYLAQSCSYAQEHIDDLEAWPSLPAERSQLLQCTSYQVACFISQNTRFGKEGVGWEVVIEELVKHPAKSTSEWETIIQDIVNEYGGLA